MRFIRSTSGRFVLLGWKRIIYQPFLNSGSIQKTDLKAAIDEFLFEQRGSSHPCKFIRGKSNGRSFSFIVEFSWRTCLRIGCCEFDEETTKKIFKWLGISF